MKKITEEMFWQRLSYVSLFEAYKNTASGKGTKHDVIEFKQNEHIYIGSLLEQLQSGIYKPRQYETFKITKPKPRTIIAAAFIDRIVHRWLVDNFLLPAYENTFIDTSYACLREKGMHKACNDVFNKIRNISHNRDFFIVKMDVRKFFDNIDKNILWQLLKKKIESPSLMNLIKVILKSTPGAVGIPIGCYSSQTFANIYLHEVDTYAKKTLKIKHYFRYMDDSLCFADTKEEAIQILDDLRNFYSEKLHLELNSKTQIIPSMQGVNFCGYKINKDRMKIRTSGKTNLIQKQKKLTKELLEIDKVDCLTNKQINSIYTNINGHFGYIQNSNCYNLLKKYFLTFD